MDNSEHKIQKGLCRAGAVIKISTGFLGVLWWLVVCFGVWLGLFFLDNLLDLPAGLRLPLTVGGTLLVAAGFVGKILWPFAKRQRVERTALTLEERYRVPDNLLINAYQLEAQELSPDEKVFAEHTMGDSTEVMAHIPSAALWGLKRLRGWGALALVLAVAWLVYWLLFPQYAGNAFARYVTPLGDIPPASSVTVKTVPSGEISICEGDDLKVRAEIVRTRGKHAPEGGNQASPLVVWIEAARFVSPVRSIGESAEMLPDARSDGTHTHTFRAVRRAFSFRVFAEDTYSRSIRVNVVPLPRIRSSIFRITPPEYTGVQTAECPGPPASLSGLPGSRVGVQVETDRPVVSALWQAGEKETDFKKKGKRWVLDTVITTATPYEMHATDPATRRRRIMARGEVGLEVDRPPEIDFLTKDRNRYVNPGATVELELQASDDFGIRDIQVTARRAPEAQPLAETDSEADQDEDRKALKTWTYMGPPGNRGPLKERVAFQAGPSVFELGVTYLVEGLCRDFRPGGEPSRSRPVILRIKSWGELQIPSADALERAFELLKKTIEEQRKANALTENLKVHLSEALKGNTLASHRRVMTRQQTQAQKSGQGAVAELHKNQDGRRYAVHLAALIEDEMAWVLSDISKISAKQPAVLTFRLQQVWKRQKYILKELVALLGELVGDRSGGAQDAEPADEAKAPPLTADDAGRRLREDLKEFTRAQKRIIDRTATLMDMGPDDLTEEEEEILGELAREEAKWARYFQEKLTDFSKLPLQDFADGSIAEEFNEIVQEIKLAAKSLYERKIELAVPQEQAGLESAEELVHNLEKWLSDIPDNIKWLMEEPPEQFDIPLAELPSELEDIVGDLIDRESEMTEDVEDVTSSWIDSIDKGAGWTAMDGPISSMSAKGITGNMLPNQQEIGGRAGEGRAGRSHGQMVEATAQGKGGRETPTRLTPSPFEPGSVEDSSNESTGGATGGGKLSGHTGEGLRGPAPPPRLADTARLAGQQALIRQSAEALALRLRAYHLPTGDLEGSINSMKKFEQAARRGDGLGIRRSFSRVIDALEHARKAVRVEVGLHREHSKLPSWARHEIMTGLSEGAPKGYEKMIAEYFRAMAEKSAGE